MGDGGLGAAPSLAKLEAAARHVLAKNRALSGSIEVGDLVSEGWLAWDRRRNWTRVVGAMRDLVRSEGRAVECRTRHGIPRRRVEVELPAAPRARAPDLPGGRDGTLLSMAAAGLTTAEMGREMGLSQSRAWFLLRRARLRLEAARIAGRRR